MDEIRPSACSLQLPALRQQAGQTPSRQVGAGGGRGDRGRGKRRRGWESRGLHPGGPRRAHPHARPHRHPRAHHRALHAGGYTACLLCRRAPDRAKRPGVHRGGHHHGAGCRRLPRKALEPRLRDRQRRHPRPPDAFRAVMDTARRSGRKVCCHIGRAEDLE